jgi:low temperature requirement protein LtrA
MSELFTPPQFFKKVHFHRHTDRSISWLELFYDLVFVATLIQIGNFLSGNVTLLGFAQFLVMLTVVWWSWTGETFYQNRYVADDLLHRLLVFLQIFAVAAMGLSVSQAFGDLYVQFTLAYVATRFILVVMYIRSMRTHPESKPLGRAYTLGFSIGILIWLGSLLLPAEIHWVGWLVGIAFELGIPIIPRLRQLQRDWEVDLHHITERFGIFTIILLGESFVKILDDAQGTTVGTTQLVFSIGGLIVLYSLWWLYFSDTAGTIIDFENPIKPYLWVYGHLPLAAGLIAFGVAAKKLYSSTLDYPDKALNPDYRLLYTAAIVLYLVALALIDAGVDDETTHQSQTYQLFIHLICAVIIGIFGVLVVDVTATQFVGVVAFVMFVQVAVSIYDDRKASLHQTQSDSV